jgi:hypothetical protein
VATPPRTVVGRIDIQNDDHVNCDGAETLNIFRIVAVYLTLFFDPASSPMIQSYLLLCDVLGILTNLKRDALGHMISPERLRDAILAHLSEYLEAYRNNGWRPKFHWTTEL